MGEKLIVDAFVNTEIAVGILRLSNHLQSWPPIANSKLGDSSSMGLAPVG